MKKLIIVIVVLLLVLGFSAWARGSNFNVNGMLENLRQPMSIHTNPLPTNTIVTPTSFPVEILITITPFGFVPDVLLIGNGTKITWVNKSPNDAGVVFDVPTSLTVGTFSQNNSASFTFTKKGRYTYHNSTNSLQKGTLIVQ